MLLSVESLFIVAPIVRILCLFLVFMQYVVSFLDLQSSWWGRGSWLLTCVVFLMPCDCYCSVAVPHGAVGWSAVCDGGIS